MRLADWLSETTRMLQVAGVEGAHRDARLLAQASCGMSPAQMLADPDRRLGLEDLARLEVVRRRRVAREPVSRIVGQRGFMDLMLEISPATLDPRPDTETVVEAIIGLLRAEGRTTTPLDIIDLGTGSGAILIALLTALPHARGLGIDISEAALAVARRNGAACGVDERARWQQGNWFAGIEGVFDVIVSNPPYIPTAEIAALAPDVARFDPMTALDGGSDGLDAYRVIARQAVVHRAAGSWLVLEVGDGQAAAVAALLDPDSTATEAGGLRTFRDLAGIVRSVAHLHRTEDRSQKNLLEIRLRRASVGGREIAATKTQNGLLDAAMLA